MEAKDTVFSLAKLIELSRDVSPIEAVQIVAIDQADYTGHIAYKEGLDEGMKVVVEWLKRYRSETTREFVGFTLSREVWQAKLKEWGIKSPQVEQLRRQDENNKGCNSSLLPLWVERDSERSSHRLQEKARKFY